VSGRGDKLSRGDVLVPALLFDDSTGSVSGTRIANGRFGLVLQGNLKPTLGADNRFEGTEKDIVTAGDLPVPDKPAPIPTQEMK